MKKYVRYSVLAAFGILFMAVTAFMLHSRTTYEESSRAAIEGSLQTRGAVKSFLEVQSELYADRLAEAYKQISAVAAPTVTENWTEDFTGIGLLNESISGLQLDWLRSRDQGLDQEWLLSELKKYSSQVSQLAESDYLWLKCNAPDGQAVFALLFRIKVHSGNLTKNRISIGLLSSAFFSSLNSLSSTNSSNVLVVDNQGVAFSFKDQQYVGSKITSHPIVEALIKGQQTEASGEYEQHSGVRLIGGFEKVARSNLYVVTSQEARILAGNKFQYLFQILFVGFVVSLLVSTLFFFWARADEKRVQFYEQSLARVQDPALHVREIKKMESENQSSHSLKFAHAILNVFRQPIASALGQLQIAQALQSSKKNEEPIQQSITSVRNLHELIENMSQNMHAPKTRLEAIALPMFMSQIFDIYRTDIARLNIMVEENYNTDVFVKADYEVTKSILKSIVSFLLNHVTETKGHSRLVVTSYKIGGLVRLSVEARGVFLQESEKANITSQHLLLPIDSEFLGLDFIYARAQLADWGGQFEVQIPESNRVVFAVTIPVAVQTEVSSSSVLQPEV